MNPRIDSMHSLSGRIFRNVLAFTLAVVLAFAVALTSIFFFMYERDAESNLVASAERAASILEGVPAQDAAMMLSEQFEGAMRFTLISKNGLVLYDNEADASKMDNHANRPEVEEAAKSGESETIRYSATLGTDTVYAARQLSDGRIIRLSETRHSLVAFLGAMVLPAIALLAVVAGLVFLLSRRLTRRIMSPINALDVSNPLDNEIYDEMEPLLRRIDFQQALLRQQNTELAKAESMRRDFSSNVSHEMKTPLQVISGYAELMKGGVVPYEDCQKFGGLIYDEAQAMRGLIDDVLTLSKLDESAFDNEGVPIDLGGVAKSMAARLRSFAEEREVDVIVKGSGAYISGNGSLADEMTYNLIENGIRYNHKGGKVTVEVDEYAGVDGKTMARMRVSDTGMGIPSDMCDKVFERFFRVDKSRSKETGGTGLGLAIVKHAVMYHGGTIKVDSVEGEGTTFTLLIPALEG